MSTTDHCFYDTYGPWRRHWTLRTFTPSFSRWWWLFNIFYPLLHSHRSGWNWSIGIRTREGGECYCPLNTSSEVRLSIFGLGFWLWCTRSRDHHPCLCDLSMWEGLPDEFRDEIFEHGGIEQVRRMIQHRVKQYQDLGKFKR